MRTFISRPGFMALVLGLLGVAQTHAAGAILPPPQKISEHVYAWIGPFGGPNLKNRGYRMNMAFVVGDEAIAVIDTGFYPAMAKEMLAHIRRISDRPIRYAINTNSQPHRYMGNDVFRKAGAEIIATVAEASRMQEEGNNHALMLENVMKLSRLKLPAAPDRLIQKNTSLDLGGKVRLDLHVYKAAHTPQPLMVHIPADGLVYAGDILYRGRLLAIVPGGNIREWLQTYDYLQRFGDVRFIPGHGQPGPLSAFAHSTREYLLLLNTHMQRMLQQEVGMQDAIRRLDQSAFAALANYQDLAGRNAHRAYQEAELASFD